VVSVIEGVGGQGSLRRRMTAACALRLRLGGRLVAPGGFDWRPSVRAGAGGSAARRGRRGGRLLFAGGLGALGSLFAHPETALTVLRHYDAVWYLQHSPRTATARHAHDPSEVGSFGERHRLPAAASPGHPWHLARAATSRCWRRDAALGAGAGARAGRVPTASPPANVGASRGRVALLCW